MKVFLVWRRQDLQQTKCFLEGVYKDKKSAEIVQKWRKNNNKLGHVSYHTTTEFVKTAGE